MILVTRVEAKQLNLSIKFRFFYLKLNTRLIFKKNKKEDRKLQYSLKYGKAIDSRFLRRRISGVFNSVYMIDRETLEVCIKSK